ncbi:hypothetical protein Tco_0767524 [Tanacetum coccineum]
MQITNASQMVKLEKDPMLDLKLEFLNLAVVCAWVICCRVSPKQKALEADIGVGVSGVDVMQAVWKAYFGSSETLKTRNSKLGGKEYLWHATTELPEDWVSAGSNHLVCLKTHEESTKVLQEGGLNVVFHHLDIVEDESIKSFYDRVKESTKVLQEGGLNVVFHHLDIVEDESIKSFYDRVKESTKVLQEGSLNVVFHHLDIVEDESIKSFYDVVKEKYGDTDILVQWDEPSSILRPDKVSPWDLEPLYGDPQCACDIYPTNNGSFINGASQGYSENDSLPPASTTSIHWSNLIEAVTKSFEPLIGKEGDVKRQTNGYKLFGIRLLDHSTADETSTMILSRAVADERPICLLVHNLNGILSH